MLCCAVLCCAVLCCVVLCNTVLPGIHLCATTDHGETAPLQSPRICRHDDGRVVHLRAGLRFEALDAINRTAIFIDPYIQTRSIKTQPIYVIFIGK